MKILLTTLNSKFIHSNLAIRYLAKYTEGIVEPTIREFTINQNRDFIISELFKEKVDLIGFSTYIWNIVETLKICEALKIVDPDLKILLGGPEISFDGDLLMEKYPFIDYLVFGEGEQTFKELIASLAKGEDKSLEIEGLIYRAGDRIIKNKDRSLIKNLNSIPSPYSQVQDGFKNRIVYYESSRGCPFNCQFCLSSAIKGVRYFDLERVKNDISNLIDSKVRQIKFVDRTFNANKKYAMEIMEFIMDKDPENINFHFEVTAHLIDEDLLNFLSKVKEGLFQFEIGVQSTNPRTIAAIGRTTNIPKLKTVVGKIKSFGNIHQHLDLIAGLPYEPLEIFKNSFNEIYDLNAEKLQLGFLKLLKGSGLRLKAREYGYKYMEDEPPYEVLENDYIGYKDIIKLKGIEDLVEKYYNEGYFEHTLEFLIKNHYPGPFEFYQDYMDYWENKKYHTVSHSRDNLYRYLKDFIEYKAFKYGIVLNNLLKYDYIVNNGKARLAFFLNDRLNDLQQSQIHKILKDTRILEDYLPEYRGVHTKRVLRKVSIEKFNIDILGVIRKGYKPLVEENERYILFNYKSGELVRCTTNDITERVEELK